MKPKLQNFHHGNLKDALIDAGIEIIHARKTASFSLREIALSLGVSHAAAYRHFASKPALIAAIAVRGFKDLKTSLERAIIQYDKTVAIKDSICAMGRAYIDFALSNAGAYRALFHPDICDIEADSDLHIASFSALQVLVDMLQLGIENGDINDKFDSAHLATSIWAALHGYSLLLLDKQIAEFGEYDAPPANRDGFLDFIHAQLFVG